jgi:hypothetical protein
MNDRTDENYQIHDISAKLAEIRRTLGIELSDRQISDPHTPSDGSHDVGTNQNTFGKNLSAKDSARG